jgi:C4-dicarboxylate transporter DctM subunit
VLAAGGTLGILIPPSVVLVVYAILTEQNIAKLFAGGVHPGHPGGMLGYILVISPVPASSGRNWQPPRAMPMAERWRALRGQVWPVLGIFLVVFGGIYTGLFTPTEGAAVGAVGHPIAGLGAA